MAESKTQSLYNHAKKRIPGGTQLLSKRPEMFAPDCWPPYFAEAKGCTIRDLDGNTFVDMSHNAVGSCLLGYAHPGVSDAVKNRIDRGSMCTLNSPEEVELADRLCAIHPWASKVRFTRSGGESCAAAIRIARATTGRSQVAICGYHGWHDWYLATNLAKDDALDGHLLPGLAPDGVPRELAGTAHTFPYNDTDALQRIVTDHGDVLAAIIMEPCRYTDPEPGFLEAVRDAATRVGAILIFDEITIGWRRRFGGAHLGFGINPDIAVVAKALGNGHPIGAVFGTEAAMEGTERSFISSTYWTESIGPVAALATLDAMEDSRVWEHVDATGSSIQTIWRDAASRHKLPITVPESYPCLAHFAFDHNDAQALKTLFTQRMLHEGFLAGTAVYPTLAHTEAIVGKYEAAIDNVFSTLAQTIGAGNIEQALEGPIAHDGFRRLV